MTRMRAVTMFLVLCAVTAISGARCASACQVDEFYHTKEGVLAATTPEAVNAAVRLEEEGSKEQLADLVKGGKVLRLTQNMKVRVLERSFEFKTLKIQLPDGGDTYWVRDGSLKQIDCK